MIKVRVVGIDHDDDWTFPITPTIFPDFTSQVWKLPDEIFYEQYQRTILWDFENEAELIHVLQLGRLIGFKTHVAPNLYMPYLPYGRQDKGISNDSTFALKVFADVLKNSGSFNNISTLDAHNPLYTRMHGIDNSMPTLEIKHAIEACSPDLICFPDKGASQRGYNVQGLKTFNLDKKRNQSTGVIEGIIYEGEEDFSGKSILIVDDLCDAGGTFIGAAKLLKDLDARKVYLFTTHGLYTKGTNILLGNGIDRLFDKTGEVFGRM